MAEIIIPTEWKRVVCDILESGDLSRIIITGRAQREWQSTFPLAFNFNLCVALLGALQKSGIKGVRREMKGADESYDFFFWYEEIKMYAKVGLQNDRAIIKIFSAHRPFKGDKL